VLVIVDVCADVLVERRHRFAQPCAAVGFLPRRGQLAVNRHQDEDRQRRGEDEGMERVVAEPSRRPRVPLDEPLRRGGGRDEIGDHDGDQPADDDLQRDGQDGLPQIAEAEEAGQPDHRRRHHSPDDEAGEQRRTAISCKSANYQRLDRQHDGR
jgi:hypothetical protein